jgi:autotransporter-associated beta strand protein
VASRLASTDWLDRYRHERVGVLDAPAEDHVVGNEKTECRTAAWSARLRRSRRLFPTPGSHPCDPAGSQLAWLRAFDRVAEVADELLEVEAVDRNMLDVPTLCTGFESSLALRERIAVPEQQRSLGGGELHCDLVVRHQEASSLYPPADRDVPRRVILVNSSTFTNVSFTQTNAGQDFELHTSGAIHVADGTQLTLTPTIKDGTGSQSITKTGAGILTFSGSTSATSTYAGGFVLEGGVVQWALSGSAAGNPFGTGPVTLRSGTLRSTTTSGRSITNSMILDGAVTLGSTEDGLTGTITINSAGGSLSTTLVSDSVVTIVAGGSTAWNQSVSGSGSLTKAGAGLLRFTPLSTLSHTGSTVVTEGTLLMAGSLTSPGPVSVQSGGTLQGTGTIAGVTTIEAGGILAPGANLGVLSFVSDLTLSGAADLELTGTTRGSAYDAVDVDGLLTYGGTLLLQIPSVLSDGTYELFKGFNSHAGSFATITLSGAYAGNLTETAGVWSGSFGGQDISFTNATGSLVIVPEPRAILLAGLGLALAVRCLRWRVTRRE